MLYLLLGVLLLAAILGVGILRNWLTSSETGRGLVYAHGIAGAIGLVVLVFYFVQHRDDAARNALILLVVAALGGFYMFFRDLKGRFSPIWLAAVHGLLALAAFFFILTLAL